MIRICQLLQNAAEGQQVTVHGWVRSARHVKSCTFLAVTDGSTIKTMQIIVLPELKNYDEVRKLTTGCSVRIEGEFVLSPSPEQPFELRASSVTVLGGVDADYPIQKKVHSLEFLRTVPHLRLRTATFSSVMRLRNAASHAIHDFFRERGFIQLHTPIITTSDCEGSGAMFQVTTLPLTNILKTKDSEIDYNADFFGKAAYLTVSGQLEAESGAAALGSVYTFGPTFRAENSNTTRHLSEFWMVEPEIAFCDLAELMNLAESFVKHLVKSVLSTIPDDMAFFDSHIEQGLIKRLENVIQHDFGRITYTEAIKFLQESNKTFDLKPEWGFDLQSEHERYLTEEVFKKPLIVTDYPKTIKPFYMYQNDDDKTVRAMDILTPRVGEIIGGSQREDRLNHLLKRMEEFGLDAEAYSWYIDLRRYGSVPHSGFGLGFERIIQFLSGMLNIRDCIPFPRFPRGA